MGAVTPVLSCVGGAAAAGSSNVTAMVARGRAGGWSILPAACLSASWRGGGACEGGPQQAGLRLAALCRGVCRPRVLGCRRVVLGRPALAARPLVRPLTRPARLALCVPASSLTGAPAPAAAAAARECEPAQPAVGGLGGAHQPQAWRREPLALSRGWRAAGSLRGWRHAWRELPCGARPGLLSARWPAERPPAAGAASPCPGCRLPPSSPSPACPRTRLPAQQLPEALSWRDSAEPSPVMRQQQHQRQASQQEALLRQHSHSSQRSLDPPAAAGADGEPRPAAPAPPAPPGEL